MDMVDNIAVLENRKIAISLIIPSCSNSDDLSFGLANSYEEISQKMSYQPVELC